MSSSFLVSIDNLDRQIDNSCRLGSKLKIFEADIEVARAVIFPLLYDLHPLESSFIYLYIFKGKSQEEIASLFGITQGAVSGRLRRAAKRLKFIYSLPRVNAEAMPYLFREFISNPMWVQVLCLMYDLTSYAVVARFLNISQGGARQAFIASVKILIESKNRLVDCPEDFLPSRGLLEFYMLDSEVSTVTRKEITHWVINQLSMILEIYDKIRNNYSIKSREKASIPKHNLIDLVPNG